ncbi:MAG TPA: LuxR C-terminal-related transcriptional regulator [Acidimicrobiales bacterium]|nr:LuxR C-terminal-related transcriptional regulator [Acidimicrobiales bacterium]
MVPGNVGGEAWPFLARAEELDIIVAELERADAADDEPGGVVIVGPAGVGKTRLLAEARRVAGDHSSWIIGTRAAALTPYGALSHLAPGTLLADHPDAASWYGAVAAELAAHAPSRPVLTIDDAHLLDGPSAALILHLAVTASATVVAAIRRGEPCPDPVSALWRDGLARRIDLQPFSRADSEALITSVLDGPVGGRALQLLTETCAGNALFVHEVLSAAQESGTLRRVGGVWRWNGEVPQTPRLVDAVEARLSGLDDDARRALAIVALGEPLEVEVATAVGGADGLSTAERAGLIRVSGSDGNTTCAPTHPLYGEMVLNGLGYFERRRLAGDLADGLAATGADSDQKRLLLTRRRLEAGRKVSPDDLARSAVIANDTFDFALGAQLARQAFDAGAGPLAAVARARAANASGDAAGAADVLADAEEAILAADSPELHRRYVDARFNALHMALGRSDDALAMLERFAAAGRSFDRDHRAALEDLSAAYRARILVHRGRFDEVIALGEPVWKRQDGPDLARLHALQTTGEALAYQGRTRSARVLHGELRALAATGRREVRIGAIWAGMQEVLCLSQEGRMTEAAAIVEGAVEGMRTSADDEARGLVNVVLAAVRLGQGRPISARRSLLDALHAYRGFDPGGGRVWALAMLAQCEALLGRAREAREALESCNRDRDALGGVRSALDFAWADACVAMVEGRTSMAPQIMLDAAAGFDGNVMFGVRALHLAAVLGADAAPLVEPMEALAATTECDFPGFCVTHVRALSLGDAASLEAVAESFAGLGLTLRAAEIAAQASRAHRAAGVHAGAVRAAARSRVLVEACEGSFTPALGGLDEVPVLSRREREVAELAARGNPNRDIATELSVSVRTVESHLYRVFAKLGVDRRSELGTLLPGRVEDSVVDY